VGSIPTSDTKHNSMTTENCLFLGTPEDKAYLSHLKHMFNGLTTYVCLEQFTLLTQVDIYAAKRSITKIVSTNTEILRKLLAIQGNDKDSVSLSNYAGSVFTHNSWEIVFVSPLSHIFSVPYGRFICERFISKVAAPHSWVEATKFDYSFPKPGEMETYYTQFSNAFAIAVDTETFKSPLSIRCIGYTAVFINDSTGAISTKSITFPIDSPFNLEWMRKFNDLPVQKITQNGKYDVAYLLRFNAPLRNWLWDTAHLFHSYYSELPKDLAFLNAFFLRKVVYWKDLAETRDLSEYYRYNGLDTWATANVWISWILSAPDWARRNYTLEFPLVYPCLLAEMTGVIRKPERIAAARGKVDAQIEQKIKSLEVATGAKGFNANSHVQVKKLLKVLGCGDVPSTKETEIMKYAFMHPLNAWFIEKILDIRGLRKLAGTYLRTDADAKQSGIHEGEGGAKEFMGFWLYTQNPHGTDTGRLASGEHHFWCGANIQNVPVRDGPIIRETIEAPPGFMFGECDLEQAESRDTAHIAGEEKLIANVTGVRDFHSINASAFFARKYEDIYDDEKKKTKDKKLRDTAKRVNHGANYNMTAPVLVTTMGLKAIFDAGKALVLKALSPEGIANFLLERFHDTYPKLRGRKAPFEAGTYYAWVVEQITITKKLVSRAFHHTKYNLKHFEPAKYIDEGDWTRYCFGKPDKNKPDLNAYVAHPPQSLNARTLNEGFMRVFYEIALPYADSFRLHAQIHDSILFSFTLEKKELAERVRECMQIPVTVRDISGTYRTFTVPAALKLGKEGNGAKYWSETE
jgi:DNA polymerase I-like protein with 3'-5' exonuclease and polymerase domains